MARPAYDPELVRELASSEETRAITLSAEDACYALGLTLEDIWSVMQELGGPRCRFYKTMPSQQRPEDIFDVYDVFSGPIAIYLKFKIVTQARRRVVVVSFKRNEHY